MELITFIILLALGLVAGLLAGLFGIGGGILFTPVLFVVFSSAGSEDPVELTIGISLFCVFIASCGSSFRHYFQDTIYWKQGIEVGLLGVIGVSFGKRILTSGWYSQQIFVFFFSMILLFVAYMFFRRGSTQNYINDADGKALNIYQAGVTGGLGGFVAVLAGIGGGGVMVPVMNLYYRKSFHRSVSISSLAIVIISLAGWLQLGFHSNTAATFTEYAWGYVDFGAALPLAFGGVTGGIAGAYFNLKANRRYLQYAFALLAVIMAVKLLVEVF